MPTFERDDLRLHYGERGRAGGPPVLLMHGLLWSSRMMERVAALLPDHRVLLLDLHGHGRSSKPRDRARYTWAEMTADVTGLLDHLGVGRAVVGGLSLGANVALAAALAHPERMAGLVLEMPVLVRGHRFGRPAFTALATAFGAGSAVLGPASSVLQRVPVPRRIPELAAVRDVAAAHPGVARAVIRGLVDDEPVAHDRESLARLTMPALVVGHRHDPLHVLDDARELAANLPDAHLVEASSILEFRRDPHTLASHLHRLLGRVEWED